MRFFGRPPNGWRRDGRLWIVVGLAAYALFGFLAVPRIIRAEVPSLLKSYLGREATLRSVSFNPFTLVTVLRDFELKDKDGSSLAAFDRLTVNLQASGLLRRAWTLRTVRLEHPKIALRILPQGRLAVADIFERKPSPEKAQKASRLPRVWIRDLAIESGTIGFVDESRSPRFATSFTPLNVRISDFSTIPERSGDHSLTVGLEHGEVRWTGHMSMDPLRMEGRVDVSLSEFRRMADYVAHAFPVQLMSGPSHLVLPYVIQKPAGGTLHAELHDVTFDVAGLELKPRDESTSWLRLDSVALQGGRLRWPERVVEVDRVLVSNPGAVAWRSEDGTFNWSRVVERFRASGASDAASGGAGATSSAEPAVPWSASCAAVDLAGGTVDLEDRTVTPAATLGLSGIDARIEGLSSNTSAPVKASLSAKVNGTGTLRAAGTVVTSPTVAEAELDCGGWELGALQPYLSKIAKIRIQSGAAGVRGKLSYREAGKPRAKFEGRATLTSLALDDLQGVRLISWDEVAAEDLRLALEPNLLVSKTITVKNPFAQLRIDRQGKLGIQKLFDASEQGPRADTAPAPAPATDKTQAFPLEIGSIQVHGGEVDYADESLILPFATVVHAAEGSLLDLSSSGVAGSRLKLEGMIDENGYAKADGTIRLFDPYAASSIDVLFRNVDMSRLTPYTAEFAGYSIKEGRLDVVVDYKVHDRALLGNHKITATQLILGDKVPGAKTSVPLKLAVALLKDSEGKIQLDVPIEGSVDDPEFAYRKVILAAFKTIMVNVTTAPFRFLGHLFGFKGDDLELVGFEAGRSALLPPEEEKLAKLVEALKSRPELALHVGGRFDPTSDTAAIKRDKLEAQIAARRETMGGGSEDARAALDRILESLYTEAFSADAREALRKKHTTDAPSPAFDGPGYFGELRDALEQGQAVAADELAALARARSDAIVAALTGAGGVAATRVSATDVAPIKKKKKGEDLVPSELSMPTE